MKASWRSFLQQSRLIVRQFQLIYWPATLGCFRMVEMEFLGTLSCVALALNSFITFIKTRKHTMWVRFYYETLIAYHQPAFTRSKLFETAKISSRSILDSSFNFHESPERPSVTAFLTPTSPSARELLKFKILSPFYFGKTFYLFAQSEERDGDDGGH